MFVVLSTLAVLTVALAAAALLAGPATLAPFLAACLVVGVAIGVSVRTSG